MAIKYRVAIVEWSTFFGERRKTAAVQQRVAFFWWVTLTHCETVRMARTYISNIEKKPQDRLISVVKK